MNINVHFAKPVSIYDNYVNKCTGKYCHCEVSMELDSQLFSVIIDSAVQNAYDPEYLQKLLKKVQLSKGSVHFCFYVLLNEVVSIRFFNDLGDTFNSPPTEEIYDTITIKMPGIEELKSYITWNLCQLNKPYDILRACLLFLPVTLRTDNNPDKFFCSQLVMHSLKDIYPCDKDINHMKPDDVYEWMSSIKENNNSTK